MLKLDGIVGKINMQKKLSNYKIIASVFEDLRQFRDKLPTRASGASKQGGMANYDDPAGLALLGMKDNVIDLVVPLKMSGGCWDSPNINYSDMDLGIQELIKQDRVGIGMAFVRNKRWSDYSSYGPNEAKVSGHLKRQIHGLRNAFQDISKTLWITLQNEYFRVYRPGLDLDKRLTLREIKAKQFFTEQDLKDEFIANKIERDRKAYELKKQRKEELLKKKVKKEFTVSQVPKDTQALHGAIISQINEGKEMKISMGSDYELRKDANGNYILCRK